MKRVLIFVTAFFFLFPSVIYAHHGQVAQAGIQANPVVLPSPTPINTFEVFWPLTAGKTRADSMYFLKMWKENIRGWLIFGTAEKSNYRVLRATKRMLEAQVLIDSSKADLAKQTVEASNNYLKLANEAMKDVKDSETIKMEMKNRLDKLIILVDQLSSKAEGDLKEQLNVNHSLIESLLKSVTQ